MQPDLAPSGRVNIPRRKAAHLTGEAVAVENFCAELRRDGAFEFECCFRGPFRQEVLSRLQIRTIVVRKDDPPLLLPVHRRTLCRSGHGLVQGRIQNQWTLSGSR